MNAVRTKENFIIRNLEAFLQEEYGHGIDLQDLNSKIIPILYTHIYDEKERVYDVYISVSLKEPAILYSLYNEEISIEEKLMIGGKNRKERLDNLLSLVIDNIYSDWLHIYLNFPEFQKKLEEQGIYGLY